MTFRPLAIAGPLFIVFGCVATLAAAGALHQASSADGVRMDVADDTAGRIERGG